MNHARVGKIARLPKAVQDQLNHRLDNHEPAQPLLLWLNELPEVRQLLATLFGGVPISKQNLRQWRRGGFREWQARQEAMTLAPDITELISEADELLPSATEPITDRLAPWVVAHYLINTQAMLNAGAGTDKFKLLRALCADISSLRRADHRSARLKLDHERFAFAQVRGRAETVEAAEVGAPGNTPGRGSAPARLQPYAPQSNPVKAGQSQSHQNFLQTPVPGAALNPFFPSVPSGPTQADPSRP